MFLTPTTDHARPSTRAPSSDCSFSPPTIATKIQAAWRGFHWRQKFLRVKRSGVRVRGSFGGAGSSGGVGHHGEKIKVSCLWYPQPSVSSRGGVAHWAGGRQPRGNGRPRPFGGECWGASGQELQIKVWGCSVRFLTPPLPSTPRLIRGFILRHAPRCPENAFFLDHVRTSFLLNLRRQLPRNVLDTSWPTPPPALREVCGPSLLR